MLLVIFDCDGVLVDSEALAAEVLANHLTRIGLPSTASETQRRYRGLSVASCLADISQRLERPVEADFWPHMQADTYERFCRDLQPVVGVESVLQWLQGQGLAFCVASSGDHEKLAMTLGHTGLRPYVEGRIYSAEDVARGKPHPDLFLHAAAQMSTPPRRCVVIEDSLAGVSAGLAAGMRVLAFGVDFDEGLPEGVETFSTMAQLPALLSVAVDR